MLPILKLQRHKTGVAQPPAKDGEEAQHWTSISLDGSCLAPQNMTMTPGLPQPTPNIVPKEDLKADQHETTSSPSLHKLTRQPSAKMRLRGA
jgi:hypothetical protein